MNWWRGSELGWCCSAHKTKGVKPQAVRRRNRARHQVIAADEVFDATAVPHFEDFHDQFAASRLYDMNDEYSCPSVQVWRALVENDEGLRFVDFDGTYTVSG